MINELDVRMKTYENVSKSFLMRRNPVIIRIDGKAFNTFTKGLKKPFDMNLMKVMWNTALKLCANIQNVKIAYTQSDEISLLLEDYECINTDAWFKYNVQKMASVSASMSTLYFNKLWKEMSRYLFENYYSKLNYNEDEEKYKYFECFDSKNFHAMFDARAFSIPKEEVCNYFISRQNNAMTNSVMSLALSVFTHKEIVGLSCKDIKNEMFTKRNVCWNDLPVACQCGVCIIKDNFNNWIIDSDIPIFTEDRKYIEDLV